MKDVSIDFHDDRFILRSKYDPYVVMLCKGAPERKFDGKTKTWTFPLTLPNVTHLQGNFPPSVFTTEAKNALTSYSHADEDTKFPDWYEFPEGVTPRDYQIPCLDRAWNKEAYALFWEMRLGKTFMAVTLACAYHQCSDIEQVLVICPNTIKDVWSREFPKWGTGDFEVVEHERSKDPRFQHPGRLKVLVVGVASLTSAKLKDQLHRYLQGGRTMLVVDESTTVKNPKAQRSQFIEKLGALCTRRLILTGTPITQGMQDLYQQFRVIDPSILGYNSYYTFRNRYCVMEVVPGAVDRRGNPIMRIAGYTNTEELLGMVANYSHTLKKIDVWDELNDDYDSRWIPVSPEQRQAEKDLKQKLKAEYDGVEVSVENSLERMTRYQQLAGGFFPYKVGEDAKGKAIYECKPLKTNPKLTELMRMLEDEIAWDKKVIIWCRFQPEIQAVAAALRERWGDVVSEFHGGNVQTRDTEKWEFQDGNNRFFVGNPATGGMGLELSAADYSIYYSNTFSYQDREQSEARPRHADKKIPHTYINLYVQMRIDRDIDTAQRLKSSMADYVSNNLRGIYE